MGIFDKITGKEAKAKAEAAAEELKAKEAEAAAKAKEAAADLNITQDIAALSSFKVKYK